MASINIELCAPLLHYSIAAETKACLIMWRPAAATADDDIRACDDVLISELEFIRWVWRPLAWIAFRFDVLARGALKVKSRC